MVIAERAAAHFSTQCPFTGTQTVRVKSRTNAGIVSETDVTASVTFQLPLSSYTQTDSQDENPAWSGTKTNTAVSGTTLRLSAANLTGTYARSVTETGTRRGIVTVNAKLADTLRTWNDCGMRWADFDSTWVTSYLDGTEVAEGLTWAEMGFTWDSLPATCLKWSGPIDIPAELSPTIIVNDGSASFDGGVFERSVTNPTPTVTMRRPHANYVPELTTMNQKLWRNDVIFSSSAVDAADNAPGTGDTIAYNGTEWRFQTVSEAGGWAKPLMTGGM